MLLLITLVLFGILSALFASENPAHASITLVNHTFNDIPMYLVVLASLLLGLVISSLIGLVNSISSSLTIRGKNVKIKESGKTVTDLTKRIHQLELENERLKTKHKDTSTDEKSL